MDIHVFYVNIGEMLTFDLNYSMKTVWKLQEAISKDQKIPVDMQVLLVSGGDMMIPERRVGDYPGTDNCPIYLFSLAAIEAKNAPQISEPEHQDMTNRVEDSLHMAPTISTISTRTSLATELKDLAERREMTVKRLVHEQHLQQQGWAAVVANMEDALDSFLNQADNVSSRFEKFMASKQTYISMLESFEKSVELLNKIPMLECLLVDKKLSVCAQFMDDQPRTLLQFLTALEDNGSLSTEAAFVLEELNSLDYSQIDSLLMERDEVAHLADTPNMKEVKGLADRLMGLEQLIANASDIVKLQKEFAQGFAFNQKRIRQNPDANILPELCTSHIQQLKVMLGKDKSLASIQARCLESKKELSVILHSKLKWIMFVEKRLAEVNGKLSLHFDNCRRLSSRLERLDQVYHAPSLYMKLCAELYRRRKYASSHYSWANCIYVEAKKLHEEEVTRRKAFFKVLGKHFLKALFPRLDKLPPEFMLTPPYVFDEDLPAVSLEDLQCLHNCLPEAAQWLEMPQNYDTSLALQLSVNAREDSSDYSIISSPRQVSSSTNTNSVTVLASGSHLNSPMSKSTVEDDGIDVLRVEHRMDSVALNVMDADGDAVSASTDEHPPGLLSGEFESSEGFLTANFFLNDELESVTAKSSGETLLPNQIRGEEIEALIAENVQCKQRLAELCTILKRMQTVVQDTASDLRGEREATARNCLTMANTITEFAAEISKEVSQAVVSCKRYTEEKLTSTKLQYEERLAVSSAELQNMQLESVKLSEQILQLGKECRRWEEDFLKLEQRGRLELLEAIHSTEQRITSQLILEHELETDKLQQQLAELRSRESFNAAREAEILEMKHQLLTYKEENEALKMKMDEELDALSAAWQLKVDALTSELFDVNFCKQDLAEKLANIEQERTAAVSKLNHDWEERLGTALSEAHIKHENQLLMQAQEFTAKYEPETREKRLAVDCASNTDEQLMEDLAALQRMELKTCTALEQVIQEKDKMHREALEQIQLAHEQELLARVTMLKESLDDVHERKLLERVSRVTKEKDLIIERLHQELSALRTGAAFVPTSMSSRTSSSSKHELGEVLANKENQIDQLQKQIERLQMSRSYRDPSLAEMISVKSCAVGDKVLLRFDDEHDHYVVFSLKDTFHFLHTDCIRDLNLVLPDGSRRSFVVAEVTDKEHCQARKPQNRFHIPVGTKFYRIRAKAWS